MDVQIKKGLLEACVLAVLKQEDSYGYKIVQDISRFIDISESTLYPILKRLESSDCLKTYTKEYNGRLRKYYQISPNGISKLFEFKKEWMDIKILIDYILEEGVNR